MSIQELMEVLPVNFYYQLNELIAIKSKSEEAFLVKVEANLKDFITTELANCNLATKTMNNPKFDLELLNQFFIKATTKYDHK